MKKEDVLLRATEVLNDLYNEINGEEWCYNEALYNEKMEDFLIITNTLSSLVQYRYNNSMTKDEYKAFVNRLIDEKLK